MNVYYIFLEGKPSLDNNESSEFAGAYINCWVKSKDQTTAKDKTIKYVNDEGWEVVNIEEIFITSRDRYVNEPDSLECFDEATNYGIGAIFYTWAIDSENE